MQNDAVRIGTMGRATGLLAASLLLAPLPAPAQAASASAAAGTTVVRGTAFPSPLTATLSFTGCTTLHGATADTTQPSIGRGPATPPSGTRSLGFDLGGGNAVGGLFMRPSMAATTTAELMVYAAAGSTGVAYAGYQEPADAGTVRVWIGRATVVAATTGWQRVDATKLAYTWTKRDLRTGTPLQSGPTTPVSVPTVIAARGGDGAGLYSVGFGCDGRPFSLDTFRVGTAAGVSTYDLEGLATATTIAGSHAVLAGDATRLAGTVRDQSGAPVPDATLILEERTPSGAWKTVYRDTSGPQPTDPVVVPAGTAVEIAPEQTATYRFRFADRPLAEGSASAPFVVTVTPRVTARLAAGRVVTGTVTPAVPGAVVTLWPSGRTTGSALARAEVARDGSYELAVPPEVGGDVVVRLAATSGLQPATSGPVGVDALVDPEPTNPAPSSPGAPASSASTPSRPDRPEQAEETDVEEAEEPTPDAPEAPAEEPTEEPSEAPDAPASGQPASTEPTDVVTP